MHWRRDGRSVPQTVPASLLPADGDLVTFTDSDQVARELGEGAYRVVARDFQASDFFEVIISLEPAQVPVPLAEEGLWEALEPIARSASNVLGDDGFWCASDRIKDWFSYDDLERVLRVARQHGWTPPHDD